VAAGDLEPHPGGAVLPGGGLVQAGIGDDGVQVMSIRPTVDSALAIAAWTTSASGRRDVVSPWSSVTPAQEMNATAKFRPPMNSTVQRPPSSRMCWSSSPGVTMTCIAIDCTSKAMAGEFVTTVSSFGGSAIRRRASASAVEDASRKIVDASVTSRAACAAIAALAAPCCRRRFSHAVAIEPAPLAGPMARAPPWTRSTSPSRASCSRSRWTVIADTAWSRASSATDTPPSSRMRSRICALRRAGGTVRRAP
jgi:hypothetical protein